jgi:hypothetical protein
LGICYSTLKDVSPGVRIGLIVNLSVRVPRGTAEEKEVFESVVTLAEMEAGPPKPPCRGRL